MSDETFSRRWLLLSVIGMLTSFLLTIGVAAFGFRGVASADNRQAKPATSAEGRPSGGTLLVREIGGSPARTPTSTVGTAPTIRETDEPFRLAQRFIQEPGGAPPPNAEPTPEPGPEPEPVLPPPSQPIVPVSRSALAPEPLARSASSGGAASAPAPTKVPDPAQAIIQPPATSTPVPRIAGPGAVYEAITDQGPAKPTSTVQATATRVPPTPTAKATIAAQDDAPSVSISLSDRSIDAGDTITVTVQAKDDKGLEWIAWESRDSGERALDRENRYDCGGRTTCVQSWTVRVMRAGTHTVQGQARDSRGQKTDDVVELRVRAAPAPTATRTPTPVKR